MGEHIDVIHVQSGCGKWFGIGVTKELMTGYIVFYAYVSKVSVT